MPHAQPLVSIVIPCYGVERFVREAVQSALDQEGISVEVIAVNDGSLDGTLAILESFGSAIQIVDRPNGGLSAARNSGGRVARGEAIVFLDGDDALLPTACATLWKGLQDAGAGVAYGELKPIDEDSKPIGDGVMGYREVQGDALAALCAGTLFQPAAGMVKTALYHQVGGFDESMREVEDLDFFLRCASTATFTKVSGVVGLYRIRAGSLSRNYPRMLEACIRTQRLNAKRFGLVRRFPIPYLLGRLKFGYYFVAHHAGSAGKRTPEIEKAARAAFVRRPWLALIHVALPILKAVKRTASRVRQQQ